ncbi:RDD family protein [Streptomyces rubrisoli]|uniref:RDD family protein n=1 Tax=Streptantibioticus rubrisoli TaxID=1387313 RepID=A0ABT1PH37_9ACTN|nr:RDD family protein [Streptantibioticus rubrisoli]
MLDFAIVLAVAVLLGSFTFHRISGQVTDLGMVGESVWRILGSRGNLPGTAAGVGSSIWDTAVLDVEEAFAALVLFAFVYQFLALVWTRRTVGKALTGLRVVPNGQEVSGPLGRRRAAVRAMVAAVTDVACYAAACCLLLDGDFVLSVLCWVIAVVIFWINALPTLLGTGRSLADRLAGTSVTGVQLFRTVAYAAADRSQAVWQGGRQVAQQVVDQERVRQITESGSGQARRIADLGRAAARGGRSAWEGTRQGAQEGAQRATERVRQISESDLGRATTEKGRAALIRARSAVRIRRPKPEQHPLPPPPSGSFGPPPPSDFGPLPDSPPPGARREQ